MRTCTECQETKEDYCFHHVGLSKRTGEPFWCRYCRSCNANLLLHRRRLKKMHTSKPEGCECCGRVAKLCLDHSWQSGSFRGWICRQCNCGIGNLSRRGDDKAGLERALAYLERVE
jgi:hypothetical protein